MRAQLRVKWVSSSVRRTRRLTAGGIAYGGVLNSPRLPTQNPLFDFAYRLVVGSQSASKYSDSLEGGTMRLLFRNLVPLLLATVLTAPVVVTGCRSHGRSQDDSYIQWEHDTHREHVDLNMRSDKERKQYDDWQLNQQERH